jgi:A/G-specific adenine glycosylase
MAPRKKAAGTAKAPKIVKGAKPSKPIITAPSTSLPAALPPSRIHQLTYHYPLLLSDKPACDALLSWFEGVEETRSMPWRKKWVDPADFEGREEELGRVLSKRAYEVWVSEVSK